MSTNRPFFANFLATFRKPSTIQKVAASSSLQSNFTTASSSSTKSNSQTKTSNTSTTTQSSTSSTQQQTSSSCTAKPASQLQSPRHHSASPYSRTPAPHGSSAPSAFSANRQRRGSDSSSEGFRDVIGPEKWYIGGRTAAGEERFYKLGVVKRPRDIDRLSLDRVSL